MTKKQKKAAEASRLYLPIYEAIVALPVGKELEVRIPVDSVDTVVQGVKREKSRINAGKKQVGMPYVGPLKIRKVADPATPKTINVFFSVIWDANKI